MGVINTYTGQSLLATESSKVQAKGKSKKKDPKAVDLKPKHNQQTSEGASSSKKNKFEKNICPYCATGFRIEDRCMKNHIDKLSSLFKQHNISLPEGAKNPNEEPLKEEDERCHDLKASLS